MKRIRSESSLFVGVSIAKYRGPLPGKEISMIIALQQSIDHLAPGF